MSEEILPPNIALMRMVTGFRVSQVLYVTAKLGIADLLKDGPKSSEELAGATSTFHPALNRLLLALVSLGIVSQDAQDRFTLTPLGTYLQADHPLSVRPYALFIVDEHVWQAWGNLNASIETGVSGFTHTFGIGLFSYCSQHAEFGETFNKGMAGITSTTVKKLVGAYDFSPFTRVVDVGGGNGSLLVALLKANPALQGVLFDLPQVTTKATAVLGEAGVRERCEVVEGDFFKSVPTGGDAYMIKLVLHDWDDENVIRILKNCAQAMDDTARLLVMEQVIPDRVEASDAHRSTLMQDLNMLVLSPGGRERSAREYRRLFEAAGFDLVHIIPLPSDLSIIEGSKKPSQNGAGKGRAASA